MNKLINRYILLYSLVLVSNVVKAQSGDSAYGVLMPTLFVIGAILAIWTILTLADNMMQVQAKRSGLDTRKNNYGLFPSFTTLFKKKAPSYVQGPYYPLTKGADIKLAGVAPKKMLDAKATRFAVQPFLYGLMSPIPKINFEVGSEVKAGDALFYDKKRPEIQYISPVSGEIVDVVRGPKRAIHQIVILADKEISFKKFNPPSLSEGREKIVEFMTSSGAWSMINQRPFDIVPDIDQVPRDIFISTFDTAPQAPDMDFVVEGKGEYFQEGINVLNSLTGGKVYLGLNANNETKPSAVFTDVEGAEKHWFAGKHPSGNVGVQIHNIKPIKPGENVWTLHPEQVITIGKLFKDGIFDSSRMVAITGVEVGDQGYVKTYMGASIDELLSGNKISENARIVAGNVLTGRQVTEGGFLGHEEHQITSLKEGDQYELFGWLLPIKPRPSLSGTFPNFLYPNFQFHANTNTHGEQRAFVESGKYEEVLPMNIYPMHLAKAILANDFEKMEGLGIYELSEEDIALCEFTCTSKVPLQKILRDGLDTMRSQL